MPPKSDIFDEILNDFEAKLLVGHFASAKTQRYLHFHVVAQEINRVAQLYAEIRRLPALDRSLILLSLDGMSYAEMAAIHGLSESNTGARLTRARQKLTQAMKGQTYE